MILADTGFLVGSISANDANHSRCIAIAEALPPDYMTTWPCLTEAMYLLRIAPAQNALQRQVETGVLRLYMPTQEDAIRCFVLMRRYADAPMDLGDASLVAAAESMDIRRIITSDRHFYAYRIHDTSSFEITS